MAPRGRLPLLAHDPAWILDPCPPPCCPGTLSKGTSGQSSFRGEGLKPQLASSAPGTGTVHRGRVGLAQAEAEASSGWRKEARKKRLPHASS